MGYEGFLPIAIPLVDKEIDQQLTICWLVTWLHSNEGKVEVKMIEHVKLANGPCGPMEFSITMVVTSWMSLE